MTKLSIDLSKLLDSPPQYISTAVCVTGTAQARQRDTKVEPDDELMQHEIFGPVVAIASFTNMNEAIWLINNTNYGLSAAVYTSDVNFAFTALNEIETGGICPTIVI